MKSIWKHVLVPLALVLITSSGVFAQSGTATTGSGVNPDGLNFNHPPCDFSDAFYQGISGDPLHPGNGIIVSATGLNSPAAQRFGIFRQFGPPATGNQKNWVNDPTCSENDPNKTNVRILATTAGYSDNGTTTANQFISIIAFLTSQQNFFTGVANARNIQMVDIISNFEAYAALKQRRPDGTFATQPCGTMGTTGSPSFTGQGRGPCFPVTSVATPQLRQDWRFATNRNALDGSDNNDPLGVNTGTPNSSPFGYFCDDLLGAWIVTYFWFPLDPRTVPSNSPCGQQYQALTQKNGVNLDGTPVIITADDLNGTEAISNVVNGVAIPCAQEGKLDTGGADGGAIWIICPAILDPRNGAIAPDAFLDHVTFPNGRSVDPNFLLNFNCLQQKGQFPGSNDDGTQPTGICKFGSGDL